MMIAETAERIATRLIEQLQLRPLDVPIARTSREGRWRDAPAEIRVSAYAGPRVRYARFARVTARDLSIANLLCLPDPAFDAPMLGIDLVQPRPDHTVVVADLLPSLPSGRRSGVPQWAEQFFSADAAIIRPDPAGLAAALDAAAGRATAFAQTLSEARTDGLRAARLGWQEAYCHAHRRDDRALGLLGRMFGAAWAADLLVHVLFPAPPRDHASLAMMRLRAATAQAHATVETILPLADAAVTLDVYRAFLAATAACAVPLEQAIAEAAPADVPFGLLSRPRATWLADDLRALAIEPAGTLDAPGFADWSHAVGAAYVLEGSTLGGQYLLKHLRMTLGLGDAGTRYLQGYGADTSDHWRACRAYVGAHMLESPRAEAAVIAGALAAFAMFERAYRTAREDERGYRLRALSLLA